MKKLDLPELLIEKGKRLTDGLAAAQDGPALYEVTDEGFVPAGALEKEAGA